MKIAVFGASGGTGSEFVQQARNDGHDITAIVRNPESFTLKHLRLRIVTGDALRPQSFAEALKGQDAVVSTLGISSFLRSLRPMTFHEKTIRNIMQQMKALSVGRLLCVTSTGVIHNATAPLFYNLLIQPLLHNKYRDMRQMENWVQASTLDWTIVRPFRLTNAPRTGHYRVAADGRLDDAGTIARSDVADLILKSLTDRKHVDETVAIAY